MDRLVKLFTVSFWKTFLEGDKRYNRFLTRVTQKNETEARLFKTWWTPSERCSHRMIPRFDPQRLVAFARL